MKYLKPKLIIIIIIMRMDLRSRSKENVYNYTEKGGGGEEAG